MRYPEAQRAALAHECQDFAGEVNKLYQRMNLAGRNAAVDRLRRKVNRLSERVGSARDRDGSPAVKGALEEALRTVHECVPLLDLNVKSLLLSEDLQIRWNQRLGAMEVRLKEWIESF
jgi:hypothetical protein